MAKSTQSGFKKGFLLAKPKPKRSSKPTQTTTPVLKPTNKRIATSSSLLDFGESRPILLVDDDEEPASLGLGDSEPHASTAPKRPLVLELDPPVERSLSRDETVSVGGLETSNKVVESNLVAPIQQLDAHQLQALNEQLGQTLATLRRKSRHPRGQQATIDSFCTTPRSDEETRFVMECLMDAISTSGSDQAAGLLGVGLLNHDKRCLAMWIDVLKSLQCTDSKQSRQRTLAAFTILGDWLSEQQTAEQVRQLVRDLLPVLADVLVVPQRTVLAQCASDLFATIVTQACAVVRNNQDEDQEVAAALWQQADLTSRLWAVHLEWTRSKNETLEGRSQCKVDILHDWQRFLESCCTMLGSEVVRRWCQGLDGFGPLNDGSVTRIGSLQQTLSTESDSGLLVEILRHLEDAPVAASSDTTTRALLRGCLTWFSLSKKRLTAWKTDLYDHCLVYVSKLLASNSIDCTFMASSLVEILWKLAIATNASEATMDATVGHMLDAMRSMSSDHPASTRLTQLVIRCVQTSGDAGYVKRLLSEAATSSSIDAILLTLIKDRKSPNAVRELAAVKLLSKEGGRSSIEGLVNVQDDWFVGCSASALLPALVEFLYAKLDDQKDARLLEAIAKCASRLMTSSDENVQHVVALCTQSLIDSNAKFSNGHGASRLEQVCQLLGRHWRHQLLTRTAREGLGDSLVEVGRQVFSSPSSMEPTILFGGLIGDGTIGDNASDNLNGIVAYATSELLKLALTELDSMETREREGTAERFRRLAPLLVLRRVPITFFRSTLSAPDNRAFLERIQKLICHLSKRLDIDTGNTKPVSFSAEERQLAAEIAGRVLPLGRSTSSQTMAVSHPDSCMLLNAICCPAFDAFRCHDRSSKTMRPVRASLYALQVAIAQADDNESGSELLSAAAFVFETLRKDSDSTFDAETQADFDRLQEGCLEFLTICLLRLVRSRPGLERPKTGPCHLNSLSFVDATHAVSVAVTKGMYQGTTDTCLEESPRQDVQGLSVESRARFWDAFARFTQRCATKQLQQCSPVVLSQVLDWCLGDKSSHHPLCLSIAIKVAVTIITRLQTTAFGANKKKLADRAHRLAMENVGLQSDDSYATREIRSASLKLLLILLSIEVSKAELTNDRTLSDQQVSQALSAIGAIARADTDTEMQDFARETISLFRGESPGENPGGINH